MSSDQGKHPLRRLLRRMTAEGIAYHIMVGTGEAYFAAMVIALGYPSSRAAIMATLPLMVGGIVQVIANRWARKANSFRRWIIACALLQALSIGPWVLAAIGIWNNYWVLLGATTLYWATGLSTTPAWNTWADTLIPNRIKVAYFTARSRYCQLALLIGIVLGWFALSRGTMGFTFLFAVAMTSRFLSAYLYRKQPETTVRPTETQSISFSTFAKRLRHDAEAGRLLAFLIAIYGSTWVAAGYFTPFLLDHRQLSYPHYAVLLGAAFIGRMAAAPACGKWAHRHGALSLLVIGAIGIVPMSAVWLLADHWVYYVIIQILGGVAWGAVELSAALLFFSHIQKNERSALLTHYNGLNALAMGGGALLGVAVFQWVGGGSKGYFVLFAASGILRFLCLGLLPGLRGIEEVPGQVVLRVLALRPMAGAILRPVVGTLRNKKPPKNR